MHSDVAGELRKSRALLLTTSAVACVVVLLDLILARSPHISYGVRVTVALAGTLFISILAAGAPGAAPTFGLCGRPRQGWWYWLRASVVLGIASLAVVETVSRIFYGTGYVGGFSLPSASDVLFSCVMIPLCEEVIYRLLLCPPAVAIAGPWGGIVITGVVFAALHMAVGVSGPDNLLGGFVLAWVFVKSETILLPIAFHSIGNLFALVN